MKSNKLSHKGTQQLRIRVTLLDEPPANGGSRVAFEGLEANGFITVIISDIPPPVSVGSAPYFQSDIVETVTMHYSEVWEYTLPTPIDDESDIWRFEFVNMLSFVLWDEKKLTFKIGTGGAIELTNESAGTWHIVFTLQDSMGSESDPYSITIIVEGDPEPESNIGSSYLWDWSDLSA